MSRLAYFSRCVSASLWLFLPVLAHAQVCWQYSGTSSLGDFVANISIAAIAPNAPQEPGDEYRAVYTSAPGFPNSSPLNSITATYGQTTFTFNYFTIRIAYIQNVGNTVYIVGGHYPSMSGQSGLSSILESRGPNDLFPNGLTASFPPFSAFLTGNVIASSTTLPTPNRLVSGNINAISNTCSAAGAAASGSTTAGASAAGPPTIDSSGIVAAANFGGFNTISPGSWIEIHGTNLSSTTRAWTLADFNGTNAPTSLDGISVTIAGQPAFIDYISPTQISAQVPSGIPTGQQQLVVTTPGGTNSSAITLSTAAPGLLASSTEGGMQYVYAQFANTVPVFIPGDIFNTFFPRAKPGDTLLLYGNGFGPVTPDSPAGQFVQQPNTLANTLQISFGGTQATVVGAGLIVGLIGLYQIAVAVPSIAPNDAVPLTFTLGGVSGTQSLYIAIGN